MCRRETMLIYTEAYYALVVMPPSDVGAIMLALLHYQLTGRDPQELDNHLMPMYINMRLQVERNNKRYDETVAKRRAAGRKGGLAKAARTGNHSDFDCAGDCIADAGNGKDCLADASNGKDCLADYSDGKDDIASTSTTNLPVRNPNPNPNPNPIPNPVSLSRETEGEEKETEFAALWDAYPRKQSMTDAREAYYNSDLPSLAALLEAIERLKHSKQWQQDSGCYIPTLGNWLRRGGWDDQLPSTNAGYIRHDDPISPGMVDAARQMLADN